MLLRHTTEVAPAAGGHASDYLIETVKEGVDVALKVVQGAPLQGRVEDASGKPLTTQVQGAGPGWRGQVDAGPTGSFRFSPAEACVPTSSHLPCLR